MAQITQIYLRHPRHLRLNFYSDCAAAFGECIHRRMPRMQVYLPEAMYEQAKAPNCFRKQCRRRTPSCPPIGLESGLSSC
jgi:hypothetical protein